MVLDLRIYFFSLSDSLLDSYSLLPMNAQIIIMMRAESTSTVSENFLPSPSKNMRYDDIEEKSGKNSIQSVNAIFFIT